MPVETDKRQKVGYAPTKTMVTGGLTTRPNKQLRSASKQAL
jgi:hypothetical protein